MGTADERDINTSIIDDYLPSNWLKLYSNDKKGDKLLIPSFEQTLLSSLESKLEQFTKDLKSLPKISARSSNGLNSAKSNSMCKVDGTLCPTCNQKVVTIPQSVIDELEAVDSNVYKAHRRRFCRIKNLRDEYDNIRNDFVTSSQNSNKVASRKCTLKDLKNTSPKVKAHEKLPKEPSTADRDANDTIGWNSLSKSTTNLSISIPPEVTSTNGPSSLTLAESFPPDVTTIVPLGVEPSSNSLPVNGNATPRDRGEGSDGSSIMGMMEDGAKDLLDVTSSGLPAADLREAERELNEEAATASGKEDTEELVDVASSVEGDNTVICDGTLNGEDNNIVNDEEKTCVTEDVEEESSVTKDSVPVTDPDGNNSSEGGVFTSFLSFPTINFNFFGASNEESQTKVEEVLPEVNEEVEELPVDECTNEVVEDSNPVPVTEYISPSHSGEIKESIVEGNDELPLAYDKPMFISPEESPTSTISNYSKSYDNPEEQILTEGTTTLLLQSDVTSTSLPLPIPPEVQSNSLPLAESSSNYLSLKSNATPRDRGEDEGSEDVTSSGLPEADLWEAEGEVNEEAPCNGKEEYTEELVDVTSGGITEELRSVSVARDDEILPEADIWEKDSALISDQINVYDVIPSDIPILQLDKYSSLVHSNDYFNPEEHEFYPEEQEVIRDEMVIQSYLSFPSLPYNFFGSSNYDNELEMNNSTFNVPNDNQLPQLSTIPEADANEDDNDISKQLNSVRSLEHNSLDDHKSNLTTDDPSTSPPPPEVTSTVPTAVEASSNYLPVNGNATPRDRGEDEGSEDVTSGGEPEADLMEAEGEVNRECTTPSGVDIEPEVALDDEEDEVQESDVDLEDMKDGVCEEEEDIDKVVVDEISFNDNDGVHGAILPDKPHNTSDDEMDTRECNIIEEEVIEENITTTGSEDEEFNDTNTTISAENSSTLPTSSSPPPEVQSTSLRPAVSSSNYFPVNGKATPGDRGEDDVSDCTSSGEAPCNGNERWTREGGAEVEYMTSSGGGLPESDLRELEGELNEEAATASGKEDDTEADTTSSGESPCNVKEEEEAELKSSNRYSIDSEGVLLLSSEGSIDVYDED